MSKYIGGKVIFDLTENIIQYGEYVDIDKTELMEYVKKYLVISSGLLKELLFKPITIVLKDEDDLILSFVMNIIDTFYLQGSITSGNIIYTLVINSVDEEMYLSNKTLQEE